MKGLTKRQVLVVWALSVLGAAASSYQIAELTGLDPSNVRKTRRTMLLDEDIIEVVEAVEAVDLPRRPCQRGLAAAAKVDPAASSSAAAKVDPAAAAASSSAAAKVDPAAAAASSSAAAKVPASSFHTAGVESTLPGSNRPSPEPFFDPFLPSKGRVESTLPPEGLDNTTCTKRNINVSRAEVNKTSSPQTTGGAGGGVDSLIALAMAGGFRSERRAARELSRAAQEYPGVDLGEAIRQAIANPGNAACPAWVALTPARLAPLAKARRERREEVVSAVREQSERAATTARQRAESAPMPAELKALLGL